VSTRRLVRANARLSSSYRRVGVGFSRVRVRIALASQSSSSSPGRNQADNASSTSLEDPQASFALSFLSSPSRRSLPAACRKPRNELIRAMSACQVSRKCRHWGSSWALATLGSNGLIVEYGRNVSDACIRSANQFPEV